MPSIYEGISTVGKPREFSYSTRLHPATSPFIHENVIKKQQKKIDESRATMRYQNNHLSSPASARINSPNDEIGPQARREAADSAPVRQGFTTTHEGLYRHPKTKTAKARTKPPIRHTANSPPVFQKTKTPAIITWTSTGVDGSRSKVCPTS